MDRLAGSTLSEFAEQVNNPIAELSTTLATNCEVLHQQICHGSVDVKKLSLDLGVLSQQVMELSKVWPVLQAQLQELHQWQQHHHAVIAQFPVDRLKELEERLGYLEQAHSQSKAFERVSAESSRKGRNPQATLLSHAESPLSLAEHRSPFAVKQLLQALLLHVSQLSSHMKLPCVVLKFWLSSHNCQAELTRWMKMCSCLRWK